MRAEVDRRKRRLGVLGYDDLLSRLADALADEDAPARERMRQRWPIVLVDEFQDTDPVQWQVLDRAFSGHATMVLIGDPKQAIYAFRGGDIVTYLQAAADRRRPGDARHQLAQRRRTRRRGCRSCCGGAAARRPAIVVREVDGPPPGHRLAGAPRRDPFRLRVVARETLGARPGDRTVPSTSCASTSPPTSPPTSAGCWPPGRRSTASRSRPATSR